MDVKFGDKEFGGIWIHSDGFYYFRVAFGYLL